MTPIHRRRLAAAMATAGAGALVFGMAPAPAVALNSAPAQVEADSGAAPATAGTLVEPNSTGKEALAQLDSTGLEFVAKRAGLTTQQLQAYLEQEKVIVSPAGFVAFLDSWEGGSHSHPVQPAADEIPGDPENGSKPGAPHTIYIDFDGHVLENTHWNVTYEVDSWEVGPYEVDADTKYEIWANVAQNYAPFDINVTTVDPGDDALVKSSESDNQYGTRLLIVPDSAQLPEISRDGLAGVAWLGGFGSDYLTPALLFADQVGSAQALGMVGSHELGHTLGLDHHGEGDDEYYRPGPGSLWGPIMGAAEYSPLTTWSDGQYSGASNPGQADIDVITDRSVGGNLLVGIEDANGNPWTDSVCPYLNGELDGNFSWENATPEHEFMTVVNNQCAVVQSEHTGDSLTSNWTFTDRSDLSSDSHGDSTSDATALDNAAGEFTEDGIIITSDDVDVFSFLTAGGPFTATAAPAAMGATLDVKLTLLDADGNVVAENEQETTPDLSSGIPTALGLDASLSEDLDLGVYYLQVEGRGQGDPANNTATVACCYSDYGSLGYYSLTGTADPLDIAAVAITSPEDGAEVEPVDLDVTGTAEPDATVTLTVDGETAATTTADDNGAWAATLDTELPTGESTITARQSIGTVDVPQSASVTVVVVGDGSGDDDGAEDGTDNGDGAEDGSDGGAEDGGDTGGDTGGDSGTDNGAEGGTDNGGDSGAEDGDGDLPDTGAGALTALAVGIALLILGAAGAVYARPRRAVR